MEIEEVLTRGVQDILPTKSNLKKLLESKKITLYQGFDPSMPSLHFGNLVGIMKLRQFQQLGHKVIFLIGDFTGMIGDPTDKTAARKQLTRDEVEKNAENWKEEVKHLLNFEGKNKVEIRKNSEWSDELTFKDLIRITSNFTVQQMIERDMFQARIKDQKPIFLHEFLYPIAQGYDSVAMDVDLEVGGSDQTFNMLAGRTLMKAIKNKEKYVLSTKLMIDKEGRKVGKTTGNALFVSSGYKDFYGGIMAFPDEVITLGFELLTEIDLKGINEEAKSDPLNQKKRLAFEVIKLVWGENEAKEAQQNFENTFQKGDAEFNEKVEFAGNLLDTLVQTGKSKSDIKRLISQGAIDLNGKAVLNFNEEIKKGDNIKIGERTFLKVV